MSTINATNIKNAASSVTNIILDTGGGVTCGSDYDVSDVEGKGINLQLGNTSASLNIQTPQSASSSSQALRVYRGNEITASILNDGSIDSSGFISSKSYCNFNYDKSVSENRISVGKPSGSTGACLLGYSNNNNEKFRIDSTDGSAVFSSNNIKLFSGGSGNYVGGINIGVANGDSDGTDAKVALNSAGTIVTVDKISASTYAANMEGVRSTLAANSSVDVPVGSIIGNKGGIMMVRCAIDGNSAYATTANFTIAGRAPNGAAISQLGTPQNGGSGASTFTVTAGTYGIRITNDESWDVTYSIGLFTT